MDGFWLRTIDGTGRHRLAGPRSSHADVTFPRCPGCRVPHSPILRLDFSDPCLTALDVWSGELVLMMCHNGCRPVDTPAYGWDYRHPFAPVIVDPRAIVRAAHTKPEDIEFESRSLAPVMRIRQDEVIDTETRVGGEPAWLQTGWEEVNGELRCVEPILACPRCTYPTRMVAQWSETGMHDFPIRVGAPGELGNPFIRFWFGCRVCSIIVTYDQLD